MTQKITLKSLCTYIVVSISFVTPTTVAIVLDRDRGVKFVETKDIILIEPNND